MDLNFTEEQLMLQDAARRIAQDVIAPSAEHFDRSGDPSDCGGNGGSRCRPAQRVRRSVQPGCEPRTSVETDER